MAPRRTTPNPQPYAGTPQPYSYGGTGPAGAVGPTGATGMTGATVPQMGPKSGRGPNGRLRNFQAMKLGKLTGVGRAVFREDNDPAAMSMIASVIHSQGYSLAALVPEAASARNYGGPISVQSDDLADILEDLGI